MADTHKHTHESLQNLQGINSTLLTKVTCVTEPGTPEEKEDQFVYLRDVQPHKDLLFKCKVVVTC
jgi:hypothetical protein